ncbi:MAG: NAD(P)H-dependent oxidoreductase [Thermomicrobium sp.]|nr:NAD(P)H-dependent oxidoreductase [Thermomicrobium sp.]MDW7981633.1 NAD(P)H-dependent oxidoreductase [Thermomicrobium sp.]
MSERPLRILGIPGSLRRHSYNRGLLLAARELAPPGVVIDLYELHALPLYDQDLETAGPPPSVLAFKQAIAEADALLIATPEYNWSVPGPLKNAIDWASRPPATSPLRRKPVGIMGAATGPAGTIRAQLALRQIFASTESYVLPKPDLFVREAAALFHDGRLVDQQTRERLRELLEALVAWTRRFRD